MMKGNIPDYPDYYVTKDGQVYSYKSDRYLRGSYNNFGYKHVTLYRHNALTNKVERKKYSIHRLVAETYIPNPDCLKEVDHIDANKTNNNVTNLQWITPQGNVEKARSKYYLIEKVSTGEKEWIYNMRKWCRERELDCCNLTNTYRRHLDPSDVRFHHTHKGYKILDMKERIR